MEANSLTEFLGRLAVDQELLEAFRADKVGTMNEYGISPEQQDPLLSSDPDRIAAALGREYMDDHGLDMGTFGPPP